MRLSQIVTESWRNVTSGAARAGRLAVVIMCVTAGLVAADILAIARLSDSAAEFRNQGGSIRVLVAENGIDSAACDRLSVLDGVDVAGAVQALPATRVLALSGQEVQVYGVSPGTAQLLGMSETPGAGVYLSASLAARWSLEPGDVVETADGDAALLDVFDYPEEDGRDPRLGAALVVGLEPDAIASECWVNIWPMTRDLDSLLFLALSPDTGVAPQPQVGPANPSLGERYTPNTDFENRITRHVAPVMVLMCALIGAVSVRRRWLELASNLHAGATRTTTVFTVLAESVVWSTTACLASTALAAWITHFSLGPGHSPLVMSYALLIALAGMAALAGACASALLCREERLYAAYKNRT